MTGTMLVVMVLAGAGWATRVHRRQRASLGEAVMFGLMIGCLWYLLAKLFTGG